MHFGGILVIYMLGAEIFSGPGSARTPSPKVSPLKVPPHYGGVSGGGGNKRESIVGTGKNKPGGLVTGKFRTVA